MHKASAVLALIVGALAVLAVGSYATADSGKKNVKSDPMSGYLEGAPGPVSTAASGAFEATIDDGAKEIHYTISYEGLEGTVTQSHIHFGQRSVSGGISAWLCGTSGSLAGHSTVG